MVIEHLWSCGGMDSSDRRNILAENTEHWQNRHLLDLLSTKDGWTFVQFVKALDQTGQEHISHSLQFTSNGKYFILLSGVISI